MAAKFGRYQTVTTRWGNTGTIIEIRSHLKVRISTEDTHWSTQYQLCIYGDYEWYAEEDLELVQWPTQKDVDAATSNLQNIIGRLQ